MAAGGNGNAYPPFPMTATKTTMVAGLTGGTSITRIREPNDQDVLSGRGGGINSHKGNKVFREWVNQRKEEYNLAKNKKEKIAVAMQVVRQVRRQVPPGRFLQRDPTALGGSGAQWWVEVDEAKALAKTTQALREGAPKIRQAHRKNGGTPEKTVEKTKKRKRKVSAVTISIETPVMDDATEKLVLETVKQDASSLPRYKSEQLLLPTTEYSIALEQLQENVKKAQHDAERQEAESDKRQHQPQTLPPKASSSMVPFVAPLTSNKVFNEMYGQQKVIGSEKPRFNPLTMPAVDPFAETPPLMATPEPDYANDIPALNLDSTRTITVDDVSSNPADSSPNKRRRFPRVHSLALSDYEGTSLDPATEELVEFVNPFADESNVLVTENDPNIVKQHVPSSVLNQWNKTEENKNNIDNSTSKCISINGYLNRLLSFSSSSAHSKDSESERNDENGDRENNGSDYFFHDDIREDEFGGGMASIINVVHPDLKSLEKDGNKKSSTSSLIRRTSFTLRNRGLVGGRQ